MKQIGGCSVRQVQISMKVFRVAIHRESEACTDQTAALDMKKGKWLDLHGVERYIGVNGIGLIFREFPLPDANVHTIHVT